MFVFASIVSGHDLQLLELPIVKATVTIMPKAMCKGLEKIIRKYNFCSHICSLIFNPKVLCYASIKMSSHLICLLVSMLLSRLVQFCPLYVSTVWIFIIDDQVYSREFFSWIIKLHRNFISN